MLPSSACIFSRQVARHLLGLGADVCKPFADGTTVVMAAQEPHSYRLFARTHPHSLTHSRTHSLTHSHTHSLTHTLTHSLTHHQIMMLCICNGDLDLVDAILHVKHTNVSEGGR